MFDTEKSFFGCNKSLPAAHIRDKFSVTSEQKTSKIMFSINIIAFLMNVNTKSQNIRIECIYKTFTDIMFHLFSLQYPLLAIKVWANDEKWFR